jgi:hypothetical protein
VESALRKEQNVGFLYVWEFTVAPDKQAAFERAYGPEGAWAQLFKKDPSYCRTELLRDSSSPTRYWTIDYWVSQAAQRAFRRKFSADFEALDLRCEALTLNERHLGDFTTPPCG